MKYLGKRPLISPHSREAITLSNIHVSTLSQKKWFLLWFLLEIKLRSCSNENVTFLLMEWPVLCLAFPRAIVRPTTSSTSEQGSAFYHSIWMATGWILAPAYLFDRFNFFVFLIHARARNTFPEVANECVFICTDEFIVSSSRMMAHPQMEEIRGRTKIVTESRVFSPSNVRACTEGFQRVNRWGRRTPSVLLVEDCALLNYMPYFRVNYLTSVSESTWKICCHEAGTESRLTTCLIFSSSYIYILQTKLFHFYNCLLPLIMSNVQT